MNSKIDYSPIDSSTPQIRIAKPANDHESLDQLITLAARGDRRAIGAIAIQIGPVLLRLARQEIRHPQDGEDLLQDLYVHLLEGRAARFPPARGRGLSWLEGLVRAMARSRRREGKMP
jgi:DNA-directed RNA polymerase specialized sigma24 family protein